MSIQLIPVALFIYKRLDHLKITIDSLINNHLSDKIDLYIFSDGPKRHEDISSVKNVRKFIKNINHFKNINILESEKNQGLSRSIISGVTKVLSDHDKVIVIEDDLQLSPYFISYMHQALDLYKNVPQVASIHGYTLPVNTNLPDTFFLKGADCWGWGTWKRAWDTFEKDGKILLDALNKRNLIRKFDLDGLVGNTQMLKDQIARKNDSWAIRWHASCFLNNMLTLHPGKSLVKNIGFDGTGEHCNLDKNYEVDLNLNSCKLILQPVVESDIGLEGYKAFYQTLRPNFVRRILRKIKSYIV